MRVVLMLFFGSICGFVTGCASFDPTPRPFGADAAMFGPVAMRIHPIFTQIKSWTGDERPDGIEVLIEFQDQFGDPTKAGGTCVFELYAYEQFSPDPRGTRLANPWIGDISTVETQRLRWNRTSRTYGFQLEFDRVRPENYYVLTATFELTGGGRFFDRMILEPDLTFRRTSQEASRAERPSAQPTTGPITEPGTRVPQP
jgi:hypothetical protein